MSSISHKNNKVSSTLKVNFNEVSVNKHKKGANCDDIDIVAIHEWMEQQEGVELFNSLRAIALLCNIVDGLDTLFFDIAKELPKKLELKDVSIDSLMDNLAEMDKDKLSPFEYIKSLQKVFEQSEHSKNFVEQFENNFLIEKLEVLEKRFKVITQEEYDVLVHGENKKNSHSNYDELIAYSNNIKFKRTILTRKSNEAIF